MAETPKKDSEVSPTSPPPQVFKKGMLVRVNRKRFAASLESKASDPTTPEYIFEGPGEILAVKQEYAQVRWRLPVPDIWLRVD